MNNNSFDLISNLPLIIFGLGFFIDFVIFIWAGIVLLTAKQEMGKIIKGRKILSNALVGLFIICLVIFVFYSITFLLQKGRVFLGASGEEGEFPSPAHLGVFAPAPEFIKIGNYYFVGPRLLKDNERIRQSAIFSVLCKRNEEYDIIYIGDEPREKFSSHNQYQCWLENCDQNNKNLYFAVFWTPAERYNVGIKNQIQNDLINQINPSCRKI